MLDVHIGGLFLDRTSGSAVVLLTPPGSDDRVLPIVIGSTEAQAIAIGLSTLDVQRPLTHDLVVRLVEAMECEVRRVDVVDLDRDTFLAEMEIARGARVVRLDCRPSDCIAVAVRTRAPIGVDRELFDRVSIGAGEETLDSLDEEQIETIMTEFRRFLDDADPSGFRVTSETDPETDPETRHGDDDD